MGTMETGPSTTGRRHGERATSILGPTETKEKAASGKVFYSSRNPIIYEDVRQAANGNHSYSRFALEVVKQGLTLFTNAFPQFPRVAPFCE